MKKYKVISERWGDNVICTIEDLKKQAEIFGEGAAVEVVGDQVSDQTGETIAVEAITIDNLADNIDEVIEMAKTSKSDLSVLNHEDGYTHVLIEIDDDNETIISAWTTETVDGYYRNTNDNIRDIIRVGRGSMSCNCDACAAGDDPAEWADSREFWPDYEVEVSEFVRGWKEGHAE